MQYTQKPSQKPYTRPYPSSPSSFPLLLLFSDPLYGSKNSKHILMLLFSLKTQIIKIHICIKLQIIFKKHKSYSGARPLNLILRYT
ncbi:hypothetical protein HanXRQr2_Chr11g0467861 [Helianthus annuus]|nr:hypothetical protein HanXRQr2_Chr11g0467861 [Helianthus annuus]KAJ0687771.1 hypothetical protein HanOQP8_Chr11g0387091 [Helianthus annuus]KAJ0873340.1 hypothetical protein HanPSC8_Chr11g0451491 [Helianthus annuus]